MKCVRVSGAARSACMGIGAVTCSWTDGQLVFVSVRAVMLVPMTRIVMWLLYALTSRMKAAARGIVSRSSYPNLKLLGPRLSVRLTGSTTRMTSPAFRSEPKVGGNVRLRLVALSL